MSEKIYNNNNKNVSKFEIWWADIPEFAHEGEKSHIQCGKRPVIIISGNSNNTHSPVCTILTLTKQDKRNLPCHIRLDDYKKYGLKMPSTIMGESVIGCDKRWLKYKMGEVNDRELQTKVFRAMAAHYEEAV